MATTHSMEPVATMRERRWRRVQAASGLVFLAFALNGALLALQRWGGGGTTRLAGA